MQKDLVDDKYNLNEKRCKGRWKRISNNYLLCFHLLFWGGSIHLLVWNILLIAYVKSSCITEVTYQVKNYLVKIIFLILIMKITGFYLNIDILRILNKLLFHDVIVLE